MTATDLRMVVSDLHMIVSAGRVNNRSPPLRSDCLERRDSKGKGT